MTQTVVELVIELGCVKNQALVKNISPQPRETLKTWHTDIVQEPLLHSSWISEEGGGEAPHGLIRGGQQRLRDLAACRET